MEALTLNELRDVCKRRNLPISGTKSELIERLSKGGGGSRSSASAATRSDDATSSSRAPRGSASALFPDDYESLTMPQLKELCRDRMLPVGGIKDDLVARLAASDPRKMTLTQLKDRCRDAGLPVTGTKPDLVDRVMKGMTSGQAALLQCKSVEELKEVCREHGVAVGGKKEELVERIKQATAKNKPSSGEGKKKQEKPVYEAMTISQLKEICREKGLAVGGNKDELVERLKAAPTKMARPSSATIATNTGGSDPSYEAMTVPQLKNVCRDRTLPVMGTKDELVKRLKDHDELVRAVFKKRKSSSLTSAAPTTSKRPVATASVEEPSAKKQKSNMARMSTGGKAPRVQPVVYAARKRAPHATTSATKALPKSKKKKAEPSMSERYMVYSTLAYRPDGWHSYNGEGERKYDRSYESKDAANARADELFYERNPWGIGRDEMDNYDIDETWPGGLLRLEVCPPDSEEWVVAVMDRGTNGSDENDVVMVSGSSGEETEDDGFHMFDAY